MTSDIEVGDRQALRDLAVEYACAVDRRDYAAVARLFTEDARLAMMPLGQSAAREPEVEAIGRDRIMALIRSPGPFARTTHFIGQQRIEIDRSGARGETYCLAHHIREAFPVSANYVMAIRYQDECVRLDGQWRFQQRVLFVDWVEERPLAKPFDWRAA